MSAGTSARQAAVRDSITGPPACDTSTEATVPIGGQCAFYSLKSGAARALASSSTPTTADPCDGSASRHGLLAADAESCCNSLSDDLSSHALAACICDPSIGARAIYVYSSRCCMASLLHDLRSESACSGAHAHRSNAWPQAANALSGATDDTGGYARW